jgi:hypothetical protein
MGSVSGDEQTRAYQGVAAWADGGDAIGSKRIILQ